MSENRAASGPGHLDAVAEDESQAPESPDELTQEDLQGVSGGWSRDPDEAS